MEPSAGEFSVEYRTVACFGAYADADAAREQLAAEGIPAAVREPLDVPLPGFPAEAVRLLVPEDELDRARAILATGNGA